MSGITGSTPQALLSLSSDFSDVSMFFCYDRGTQQLSMCVQAPGYDDSMMPLADLSRLHPDVTHTIPLIWTDGVTGIAGNDGTPVMPGMHDQVTRTVEQLERDGCFTDSYEAFVLDARRMKLEGGPDRVDSIILDEDDRNLLAELSAKAKDNQNLFCDFLKILAKFGKFSKEQKLTFFKIYNQNMFVSGKLIPGTHPIFFSRKEQPLTIKIAEENGMLIIDAKNMLALVNTDSDTQDIVGECHSLTRFSIDKSGSAACITATSRITRSEGPAPEVGAALSAIEAYNNLTNDYFRKFSCKQIG